MGIKIQNITWKFQQFNDEILGYSHLGIPHNMLKRFIKECGWNTPFDNLTIPHYEQEETNEVLEFSKKGSEHECYNADTQIVLMNWLHGKKRSYTLSYGGEDPFWLFHDNRHSKYDVLGDEVNNIYAFTEYTRILQGAEMAKDHGHVIKVKTAFEIMSAWYERFKNEHTPTYKDFEPFMDNQDLEHLDKCQSYGEYVPIIEY